MNLIPPNVKLANSSNFYDTTIDTVTRANIFSTAGLQAIQDFLEDYQEEHQICVNANFIRWVFGEYKSFSEYVLYNGNQRIKTLDELRDVARLLPIDDWRSGFIFIDPNIDTIKI